jgi:ribonuclease Z
LRKGFFLAATLVIVGLALAGAYLRRDQLALQVLQQTAQRNMTRSVVAQWPDGLHAAFCGTGSPMPDRARAGPCLAVIAGKRLFVFDAGGGASETINQMGLPTGEIESVFLTHFHSDHIDDLGALSLQRWAGASAKSPLKVVGPPGVERVVAGFNEAYALDAGYRVAHHGPEVMPPSGAGLVAAPFQFAPGADSALVLDDDGVRITAFLVDHSPISPAVGYRIDYAARSIVISGDTLPSPVVERHAHNADLLVHEALSPRLVQELERAASNASRPGIAHIMHDIQDYHTSPSQAALIARRAGVRALALTHVVPPLPNPIFDGVFLGDAPNQFGRPVWVMRDGDAISLPRAGGMERSRLLRR